MDGHIPCGVAVLLLLFRLLVFCVTRIKVNIRGDREAGEVCLPFRPEQLIAEVFVPPPVPGRCTEVDEMGPVVGGQEAGGADLPLRPEQLAAEVFVPPLIPGRIAGAIEGDSMRGGQVAERAGLPPRFDPPAAEVFVPPPEPGRFAAAVDLPPYEPPVTRSITRRRAAMRPVTRTPTKRSEPKRPPFSCCKNENDQ